MSEGDTSAFVSVLSVEELTERKEEIGKRLEELDVDKAKSAPKKKASSRSRSKAEKSNGRNANHSSEVIPFESKIDTHWDFLMKEMMWLAADFQSERKRQLSLGKRIAGGVRLFHKTKESRRARELAEAELKRRRLGAKISREAKGWWAKIERVIAYKQKLGADEERRKGMNQQLVSLVKQTERYGESIVLNLENDQSSSSPSQRQGKPRITIEEALATTETSLRRRRKRKTDYSRMKLEHAHEELYGETTTSDSGSDGSFVVDSEMDDDETTIMEAEVLETRERLSHQNGDSDNISYVADPNELKKLQEETEMDIDLVIQRLHGEAKANRNGSVETPTPDRENHATKGGKRVTFSPAVARHPASQDVEKEARTNRRKARHDPGHDADDDGDANDVKYFKEGTQHSDGSDYENDENEVDDETTVAAEERLGREMSVEDEIALLQSEGELPIEELRKLYAPSNENGTHTDSSSTHPLNGFGSSLAGDGAAEEEEFRPPTEPEIDDETTIEAEERLGREITPDQELQLLKDDNEISIEQLRAMYASMQGENESPMANEMDPPVDEDSESKRSLESLMSPDKDNEAEGDEYIPTGDVQIDDETTIEAEEKLGRDMSYEDELDLLKEEGELSVDDLRKLYGIGGDNNDGIEINGASSDEKEKKDCPEVNEGPERKRRRKESQNEKSSEDEGLAALKSLRESEERAKSTLASRPFLLPSWVKLRAYQQIGLNWLVSIQSRRLNGILADEMGLGKTLQTISLLSYLAAYKGIWGPHLVIVPTSCIVNWETEIKRFCPAMKVLCYYGSAKRRKELRTGWTKPNWYHVVVTSYQLAVLDSFAFKRKKWYYLILDEAHNIKNFQSQRWQTLINFNTQRRLLLTGTPLQNNLTELWSLLHFLMPHVFRSRKEFAYWFSNPMNSMIEGNARRSDDLIGRLHGIIRPFVLRRLKKDVETQMPGKFEHIIKCPMSRRQMFLYEEFMARSSTRQALKKGGNFMGMMNVLMQLRKVCNHPDLFEPRAVITPFCVESIVCKMPGIAVSATTKDPIEESLSEYLQYPLWCGSTGLPCPDQCREHDFVEAEQLQRLGVPKDSFVLTDLESSITEPPPREQMNDRLATLLKHHREREMNEKKVRSQVQGGVNSLRCWNADFPYSCRLVENVSINDCLDISDRNPTHEDAIQILTTPAQLLAARKSQQERADGMDETLKKFVFCIPKAGSKQPSLDTSTMSKPLEVESRTLNEMLAEPIADYFRPFRQAEARLSSFFPDKRLVQFDAGKLQTLAELLHRLKSGRHKALIFTQMSKMLDVLEAFLNLNGHTYLRLDGSTGVERRQRLMDKFNNDEKIFCFILSTRSGGLGINLTGADTVIFFDTDWNPAMDAQAQDRAHRIGQTRDVHIYRLITESSIEENIWTKAQQKRNLDLIVMDEGKFDAGHPAESQEKTKPETSNIQDVFSKGGLRDIFGVSESEDAKMASDDANERSGQAVTKEQMEMAMASLEDEEDVAAMKGAQREAEDELKEFDETIEYQKEGEGDDNDEEDEEERLKRQQASPEEPSEECDAEKKAEEEMIQEFNTWQTKVGMDAGAIEATLTATERYGLNFRETVDPFLSIFAVMEQRRKEEAMEDDDGEVDIEEVEHLKALDERTAFEEGDLLGTNLTPEELPRQRHVYYREKSRRRASKKRRRLTGSNWVERIDSATKAKFWYNEDTGEAIWDKPKVLLELDAMELAYQKKWNAMPVKLLVRVMEYLISFPDRTRCSVVCHQWNAAATDISYVRHVFPVELSSFVQGSRPMEHNHFRTIAEAVSSAQPGDTIELGDGHYWVNEPGLDIPFPLKFVGDEHDPSHVVIELSGTVRWRAKGGFIEGVTMRRPRMSSGKEKASNPVLAVELGARIDMVHCVLNNEGNGSHVATLTGSKGRWTNTHLKGSMEGCGVVVDKGSDLELSKSKVTGNKGAGISCLGGSRTKAVECFVNSNQGPGVLVQGKSRCEILKCRFGSTNSGGLISKDPGSSCIPCQGNTAILGKSPPQKSISGIRFIHEDDNEACTSKTES